MEHFIIKGGKKLKGEVFVSGAKNVALKAMVAACLTDEEVIIENIPLISDFMVMSEVIKELGGEVELLDHRVKIQMKNFKTHKISLEKAAEIRTASMLIAPLLSREKEAIIPNPGGCRLGARPIDRTIEGLRLTGAEIDYKSEDGFFHAKTKGLHSTHYTFEKNTHTGTETMVIAAVLANGKTVLENAAEEPEIDELIALLNAMGAKIKRLEPRMIEIQGVEKLHGTTFRIQPDRNEIVTFAIAALVTKGDIFIHGAHLTDLKVFIQKLKEIGAGVLEKENGIRFFYNGQLKAIDVTTTPYPGFMTDWQAPWAVLMTQALGESIIHETVFENRFGYVLELLKMGAKIEQFNPHVANPKEFYNFNLSDDSPEFFHAIKIFGPTDLHDAAVTVSDLRAGATLVLAALAALGTSTIFGISHLDRGYEKFEERLNGLGAEIKRLKEII